MANILEILQTTADELGLTRPSSVASDDPTTRQFLSLANVTGKELMKEVDWTELQSEYVIEFGATTELSGDTTEGSRVVTNISSTAGLTALAYVVSGSGIQQATRVASVDSGTQITLTQAADTTGTIDLTFTKDTFDLPSDFDRYIDQTQWDRRFSWELIGPQSPQMDQFQQSGIVTTGPRRKFRQIGRGATAFRIWPPPSASNDAPGTLVWEYISKNWVNKADGSFASALTANDDEVVFPEEQLLIMGIKWRFWQIKGFGYADLQAEYMDWMNREKARNGGQKIITLSRRQSPDKYLISSDNVPDGNFPAA